MANQGIRNRKKRSGRQGRLTTVLAGDIFAFGFKIDGKGRALLEWQGWLVGVVWFVIGFLVDRGRVEVSFQGLERIAYLAVYVLFVLPVNLQTYSRARAKPAVIAADGSKGN